MQVVVDYPTAPSENVSGVAIGYGSHMVKCTNIYLKRCTFAATNSVEFVSSTDIIVDNLTIDEPYIGISVWHLAGFKFTNVTINLTNRYANVYAVLHTIQPFYKFGDIVSNDELYTQNTSKFKYDNDYDFKARYLHLGVDHYRYHEYLPNPSLRDGAFDNLNITLTKSSNTAICNVRIFGVQGLSDLVYSELIENGRFKVFKNQVVSAWENVQIKNVTYHINGDLNATTAVRNTFLVANFLSLVGCELENIKYTFKDAAATLASDTFPDISDMAFLNVAKLVNTSIKNVRTLPFAFYGNTQSSIRAFDNLIVDNFETQITNIDGSYNPTFLKFFEARLSDNTTDQLLTNEDYEKFTFTNSRLKGFQSVLHFTKAKASITDSQLKSLRFTNNDITNSAYNESSYAFVKDSVNVAINQVPLKQLNTINNVPIV